MVAGLASYRRLLEGPLFWNAQALGCHAQMQAADVLVSPMKAQRFGDETHVLAEHLVSQLSQYHDLRDRFVKCP